MRAWSDKRANMKTLVKALRKLCAGGADLRICTIVMVLGFGLAALVPNQVKAQDIDWVLNLEDTGYDPTPASGLISYSLSISNSGLDPITATSVDLTIPANSQFTGMTGDMGPCLPATATGPAVVRCDVPALAGEGSVAAQVNILSEVMGNLSLSAAITDATDAPQTGNNQDTETTTVSAGSDLGVTISGPTTAASGSMVTYTFEVTNNGPNTLSSAALQFPTTSGLVNVTPPAGCSAGADGFDCTITGPLALGASRSFDFTGQISAASGSTISPLGSVHTADPLDPIDGNDTDTIDTSVTAGSDIQLNKSRSPNGNLLVGDTVSFTLSSSYTGDSPTGLQIIDTLPANYAIDSVVPDGGSDWICGFLGQVVTCDMTDGTIAGANVDLGDVTVNVTVVSEGTAQNTATISSTSPLDPDLSNNSDSDSEATIVQPFIDLDANKTGPFPALGVVGNTYEFTLNARNRGNTDFWGTVILTDSLPAGLRFTGYRGNGWSCSPAAPVDGPNDVTCSRTYTEASPLPENSTTPDLILETETLAEGDATNRVTVTSPDPNLVDENAGNDNASVTLSVHQVAVSADITVSKTTALATLAAGEVQTYYIEVINPDPFNALDVEVTDDLTGLINNAVGPTDSGVVGWSVTSNSASGITCNTDTVLGGTSRQLFCDFDTLRQCTPGSGGDCPIIEVQVRPGGNGGSRTNTVDVISMGVADGDLTNNTDSASFTLTPRADVTVSKVGSPGSVPAGQNLTYVISAIVTDDGLSAADDVTITDTLPHGVTFVSASPSAGSCTTVPTAGDAITALNDQLVCDLGRINNGAQRTVTVVVRPNHSAGVYPRTITNAVSVATSTVQTDTSNDSTTETTTVTIPAMDLIVNKTEDIDPVAVGQETTYTITVENGGPSHAEDVVVTDTMPAAGLNYQSYTAPGGVCTAPAVNAVGGTLTCSYDLIPAGEVRTITLTAMGVTKGIYDNSVSVSSFGAASLYDTNSTNDSTTEGTTVRTRADMEVVSKTPSAASVNLRDDFTFVIRVRNNVGPHVPTGAILAEADEVEVADTLPSGMELTGTPSVAVVSGSITASTCTGAAGGTSFTCDLGTVSSGGEVDITVPVQLVSVSSLPHVFTNTATVDSFSLDMEPGNNSNSGSVSVNSSVLSGRLFRDFNDDGAVDAGDTGIAGISMTLTGTSFDGQSVTRTVTTDANGDYQFDYVPQGIYQVRRGSVSEDYLSDGTDTPGTLGGTAQNTTDIAAITLPANTSTTGYLFAMVPQARIGIAKEITNQVMHADGSFDVTFGLTVENFSLEDLENVTVMDPLSGAAPSFGTLATLADPANDPMVPGTYVVTTAPSSVCGGAHPGFNGNGDPIVATGITLSADTQCVIDFTIRVQPTVPLPAAQPGGHLYENQAEVQGDGVLSGQVYPTNPLLRDLSDNDGNPDRNDNGRGNDANEDDPTPVTPGVAPAIDLVKTVSGIPTTPQAGDTLTYSFTVTNTGNVDLSDVQVVDPLLGGALLSPTISLAMGANHSFNETYVLTQADIDAGQVVNNADTSGRDPYNTLVEDDSGTTTGTDGPTTAVLPQRPSIALVKTADVSGVQTPAVVGDPIIYSFSVENTGNVTLSDVQINDPMLGGDLLVTPLSPLTLAPGQTVSTAVSVTYTLTQADLDEGQVVNQARVTGTPPTGPDATDDSGTATGTDDPTASPVTQNAAITLEKEAQDEIYRTTQAVAGDPLTYEFTVTNTGNVTLTNVTVTDPMPGLVITNPVIPSLAPGAANAVVLTGSYPLLQADIDAGEVPNTATVTGDYLDVTDTLQQVSDTDSDLAIVAAIEALAEVFPAFSTDGGTTTSMLASDTVLGDPATLATVTISVLSEDPGVTLDPATGLITLAPGQPAGAYEVHYEICSVAYPAICDDAVETVVQNPIESIEAVKSQLLVDNGDGVDGVGDRVDYTITLTNTGNVPLISVSLVDTLTNRTGTPLSLDALPVFVSADLGSAEGRLEIGETATYTASYTLTIQSVTEGGLLNSVTGRGTSEYPPMFTSAPRVVTDVSDDDIDTDGNMVDDPTELILSAVITDQGMTITKTTPRGVVERGSVVPYTITVENENVFVSGTVDIVDVLPDGLFYVEGSATLEGAPHPVVVAGRVITWDDVPLPPLTTYTLTLSARVSSGADVGDHINRATVRHPDNGTLLAEEATATVRILPEPVFDCGDVIGKVFEDENRDGYQNEGEAGLPAARVVGVDGTIITTDEHGRFHVPCAMLPADRGSNFILKLDTRSLPAGYRVTTENPRVIRLTPGKMSELNFGAAITRVVRVDLSDVAFVTDAEGRKRLSEPLVVGLAQLLPQIKAEAVHLRLAYHLGEAPTGADKRRAGQHMQLVARHLRREWPKISQVKLTIERTFVETRK